jgi:hypothetical protein
MRGGCELVTLEIPDGTDTSFGATGKNAAPDAVNRVEC